MFNKINIPAILAAIVLYGNQYAHLLPTPWANLVSAILGIIALYNVQPVIAAARRAGHSI